MKVKVNDKLFEATVQLRMNDTAWGGRESRAITAEMTYQDAIDTFVEDVAWSVMTEVTDENEVVHEVETDYSIYAIPGPVTDNRDGTVTVRMGKYRQEELMRIPLVEAPASHVEAIMWREIIEDAAQKIESDEDALVVACLYPLWADLIGASLEAGTRLRHDGKLFKVIAPHTASETWVPGVGTESLYVQIDETHDGTLDDPIPYGSNMELVEGLYYVQDGVVYLCNRSTGAPVYNALDDLVGIYVEIA